MRLNKDITGASVLVLLSVVLWLVVPTQIKINENIQTLINAQFMPRFIIIVLFILSVIFLIQSVLKSRKEKSEDNVIIINFKEELRALVILLILVIYAVAMPIIGFIASSILSCFLILFMMKTKNWLYYVISFTFVLLVYFLFTSLLNVRLP